MVSSGMTKGILRPHIYDRQLGSAIDLDPEQAN
jgi:hypothetical protein